jgi:hypothetical protein
VIAVPATVPWTALFFAALVIADLATWHLGGRRLKDAAAVVTAVWLITFAYAKITGDYTNWRFMFAVDVMAAARVLRPPCNVARLVIGALYVGQIMFHGVYGSYELRGLEGPSDAYLQGLYVLGAIQLAALLFGASNDWSRRRYHRSRLAGRNPVPLAALSARNGKP